MRDVLGIVLAGGRGARLEPLTRDRAKPAVPFGGIYRIIDFPLSNCINSGIRRMLVLTQYKAISLNRHIDMGWRFLTRELGEYIDVIPPQQRLGEQWYQGTADAIYQNIYSIEKAAPRDTLILAGDHIYKMNYAAMVDFHRDRRADLTIACLPVPRADSRHFGVMEIDDAGRVVGFLEKPAEAASHSRSARPDPGLDGHLRLRHRPDVRPPVSGRRQAKFLARLRQGHHPRHASGLPRIRLPVPGREPQGGRLLARRGHPRRLLPGQHGPDLTRPDFKPLRRELADPDLPPAHAAAQVCPQRGRAQRRGF